MVLRYHGISESGSIIANALGAYLLGVSREQLSTYVHDKVQGLSSDIVTGWDNIKTEIASSRPVIAQLGINSTNGTRDGAWPVTIDGTAVSSNYDGGHYVVVVDLVADINGEVSEVGCNDPANWKGTCGRRVHYTASSFDEAWDDDYLTRRDRHMVTVY